MTLKFKANIRLLGINPYVLVSKEQAVALKPDWRKPMPVLVKINAAPVAPCHTNMMPAGDGNFYLYLHGGMRKASAAQVGDIVMIELDFDAEYRNGPSHEMPAELSAALERQPDAKRNWDKLSPSRQKEILRYFASLKSQEAKARNVERALGVLSGNSARFMARSWRDGS